jgi:integrase
MPLELRRNRDGSLRPEFYGRYQDKTGKLKCANLGIKIKGCPPKSLHQGGDKDFEDSRELAEKKLAELMEEGRTSRGARYWAEKVYELKSGVRLESPAVDSLPEAWAAIPRKRKPSAFYLSYTQAALQRFSAFMAEQYPQVKELAGINRDHVQAFMEAENKRGVSARTWNGTLGILRSVFRHLEPNADGYRSYLLNTPGRIMETIHREPFTVEEIKAVLDAALNDDLMRPLITTALCTAMRRGDCALLKWSSVDLAAGFITVKTSKTGENVDIPILPALRTELSRIPRGNSEYVFPAAATMYKKNPDGLNWRLRDIFAKAGFVDADTADRMNRQKEHSPKSSLPILSVAEVHQKGLAWIDGAQMTEGKRGRLRTVFEQYIGGQTMPQIARELGISKGSVSGHIGEIEAAIKAAIVRRQEPAPFPAAIRGVTQSGTGNEQRRRRGNVKGWHSFRTTFITLALSAGMPMELVRRVTGHTTVDVVLKHYFRPGRQQFQTALQAAMPKLLMNGAKSRDEQLREIISGMTPKILRNRALAILDGKV